MAAVSVGGTLGDSLAPVEIAGEVAHMGAGLLRLRRTKATPSEEANAARATRVTTTRRVGPRPRAPRRSWETGLSVSTTGGADVPKALGDERPRPDGRGAGDGV